MSKCYDIDPRQRAYDYGDGFSDGRAWAEYDIRSGSRDIPDFTSGDAYQIGVARGYRDTWARWDAGTLTASMLEHAPLGR